jgi:hypothetical protein
MTRKNLLKATVSIGCAVALQLAFIGAANAATLKAGTCRGVSTNSGYKYVGTYCVDFSCSVTTTLMFDSWCPYSVDI